MLDRSTRWTRAAGGVDQPEVDRLRDDYGGGERCRVRRIAADRDEECDGERSCRSDGCVGLCRNVVLTRATALLLLLASLLAVSSALPVRKDITNAEVADTVTFMSRYGYLPQSDLETGNLRTEQQLREAIRTMQRFGNIPATGDIDAATLRLMRRKRCGNSDLPPPAASNVPDARVRRYAVQGVKWPKTDLTWSIGSFTSSLERDVVRSELSRAFKIWSDSSRLTFREVAPSPAVEGGTGEGGADILVSFYRRYHGDGYPFDGQGAILAHAFFPGDDRGGDTHFDDEENWIAGIASSDDGVSLLSVAAHEFGHSLGLSHSSVPDALMFPYYQGLKTDLQLPYDDMIGIQQLYGATEERPWAPIHPTAIATRPPRPPPTSTSGGNRDEPPVRPPPTSAPPPPPRRPHPTPAGGGGSGPAVTATPADKPDTCDTDYDAIALIRHEIFVFKGRFFWRLDDRGLRKDYPVEIERFWYRLPENLTHVDALYERPKDKRIMFFIGKQYWLFDANHPMDGYPKPLTALGLPADIEKLDAAMVWGHNSKTYLFSGTMYWRFDEDEQKVELDYPRDMSMWQGVPPGVDAAFQWTNGHTYFFKGKGFWKFNDRRMRVESMAPTLSGPFWMGCPDSSVEASVPEEERRDGTNLARASQDTRKQVTPSGVSSLSRSDTTQRLSVLLLPLLILFF